MKILYLFPHDLYQRKMSIGRVLYGEAVGRQAELAWGGIGWPGFDPSRTVMENYGPADAVWLYKAEGLKGLDEYPVRVICFNEAYHEKTLGEIADAQANLVVFHHHNDMDRWTIHAAKEHWLHGAEYFVDNAERPIPCLLSGVVNDTVYPLRHRLTQLVSSGLIPGRIRRHPGYRLPGQAALRKQYKEYIGELAQAQISLCCTSAYRYPLAKIIESMAAGCAVVSDMPEDEMFQSALGPYLIEINQEMSDREIVSIIRNWLEHPRQLSELAQAGQQAARQFSTDAYAQNLIQAVDAKRKHA